MKEKNRRMPKKEDNFKESISHVPEAIGEQPLHEMVKNAQSLKDESLEMRKQEAKEVIYLARYE